MTKLSANLLLLLAAAMWGVGNVPQKTVLDHLDPLSAVGLRCLIGGLLVLPFMLRERRATVQQMPANVGFRISVARVAALFAVSIALQQIGYLGTSVTSASFLIETTAVMTPLAAWLFTGERLTVTVWFAAGLTLIGALLLAGGIDSFSQGDVAVTLSAACYSIWTVELGRHMRAHARPFTTMVAQCLGATALILPFGLSFGNLSLATALEAWPELLALGLFSTAAAFSIQAVAQRFTSASYVAVIVSAESVFGAAAAALFLDERISPTGMLGGAVMLGSILYLSLSTATQTTGAVIPEEAS